ncbi:MAG: hypothetical protein JW795_19150 [Chitinivibrionales bacterium]|nr:hypothetical protein [Chitinivibrionales bacterium]
MAFSCQTLWLIVTRYRFASIRSLMLGILMVFTVNGKEPAAALQQPLFKSDSLPLSISFIREMEFIPYLDTWQPCSTSRELERFADRVLQDWKTKRQFVRGMLSPTVARSLSLWGRVAMKKYKKVGSIDTLTFKPIRCNPEKNKVLFEATIDTLPSHSPIVVRWFRLYLLYDSVTESVNEAIITIRGYLFE